MEAGSLTDDTTGAVRGTKRLLDSKSGCSTCSSHMEHEYPRTQGGGLAARLADGALRTAVGSSSKPQGAQPQIHSLILQGTREWRGVPPPRPPRALETLCLLSSWAGQLAPGSIPGTYNRPSPCPLSAHPCHSLSQLLMGDQELLPFINPPAPWESLGVLGTPLFPSHSNAFRGTLP